MRPQPSSPFRAALLLASLLALLAGPLACGEERYYTGADPTPDAPDAGTGSGTVLAEPPAGAVRIAALNVHRLFDTVCASGTCGGSAYEALPTPAQLQAQAGQLAAALSTLKAGVVLVEEVETQASLDALTSRLPGFPHAFLAETGGAASVDVGVLSRHPITSVRLYRLSTVLTRPDGTPTTFTREFPEVHLDVAGAKVIVFPAHFKAKSNDDPGRRYAEAQAAHDILVRVAAEFPRALVVMGGDLNDTPDSRPLEALEQSGALLRVASDRPDNEVGTYLYNGVWQAIDHLFFARGGSGRYLPGSFRAVRDAPRGFGGSDHSAVLADFELPR